MTDNEDFDIIPAPDPGSARDRALAGLDPETRAGLIQDATDAGVYDKNDGVWWLLRRFRDGMTAADRAALAADQIEVAARSVGQGIYDQTVRAGNDLKAVLATALEKKTLEVGRTVVDVIRYSANEGATAIKKAAAGLPAAAAAQRDGIIADWKTLAASTAAQEAATRARRGEWWVIGASVLFGLVMAVAGGWMGYQMAPRAWPAAAPPAAMWRFPKRNLNEYAWPTANARLARACPTGDVCLDLRRR
jgi:hypothetical protein